MTTLTTGATPKALREALCIAEAAVARSISVLPTSAVNRTGRVLADLIRDCDRHRPLGPDGTHGARHTLTCGCEDIEPFRLPPTPPWSPEDATAREMLFCALDSMADEAETAAARGMEPVLNTYLAGSLRMRAAFIRTGVIPAVPPRTPDLAPPRPMPAAGDHPVGECCDVCSNSFESGQWWTYHARLQVYVHGSCAATSLVRGEDISNHTVLTGQMP